jgi:transcriptional regulator with XRE-family HTH domain
MQRQGLESTYLSIYNELNKVLKLWHTDKTLLLYSCGYSQLIFNQMEAKEIRKFLGDLNDLDFRYLRIQISMANDARTLVRDFNLSKEQFCELIQISPKEYNKYMTGGFNYDIRKMALIQAAFCKLQMERTKEEAENKFTDIVGH